MWFWCVFSPDEMLELRAVLQKSKLRNSAPSTLQLNSETPSPFTFKILCCIYGRRSMLYCAYKQ